MDIGGPAKQKVFDLINDAMKAGTSDEPDDPLIVIMLERQAKANAGAKSTGLACEGRIGVRYYPACDRYAWFDENGAITKRLATELQATGKWQPPSP